MPLLKLWNSIRGRSTRGQSIEDQTAESVTIAEPSRRAEPSQRAEPNRRQEPSRRAEPSRRPGLALFGGGPHAGLCKLVRSVPAGSLLEISVEDGSRAVAVHRALARTERSVRYFAIDQFEMAEGGVSLKQFHQALRAKGIRPNLLPGSIDRGLMRIACTVGTVDLVLISDPPGVWQTPKTLRLLERVSHAETVLLYREGEAWQRSQPAQTELRRAA
jgi:hypothetical protein